jgi:lipoate-protein ligase A
MIRTTRILTTRCTNPHRNLALEDALLTSLPEDQAILYLWQNRHTVVIGAGQNACAECRIDLLEGEGGTLARRSSGGGAVYHDLGNLNFSFIVPRADYDVARQLTVILEAARALGVTAEPSGRNDLTAEGRKFSGNAFRVLKDSALHHGTLLVNVDMGLIGRYLNVSKDKLQAKGVKSVPARVVNLSELSPAVTIESMRQAVIEAFSKEYGPAPVEDADDLPIDAALLARYESGAWNYGKPPEGDLKLQTRFPWGGVELNASVADGLLKGVAVFTDAMDETLSARLSEKLEGCPYSGAKLKECACALDLPDLGEWLETL